MRCSISCSWCYYSICAVAWWMLGLPGTALHTLQRDQRLKGGGCTRSGRSGGWCHAWGYRARGKEDSKVQINKWLMDREWCKTRKRRWWEVGWLDSVCGCLSSLHQRWGEGKVHVLKQIVVVFYQKFSVFMCFTQLFKHFSLSENITSLNKSSICII